MGVVHGHLRIVERGGQVIVGFQQDAFGQNRIRNYILAGEHVVLARFDKIGASGRRTHKGRQEYDGQFFQFHGAEV